MLNTVEYAWPEGPEQDCVRFTLWPGYGCRTSLDAHRLVRSRFLASDPATIRDEAGEAWEFYLETVRGFAVQGVSTALSRRR